MRFHVTCSERGVFFFGFACGRTQDWAPSLRLRRNHRHEGLASFVWLSSLPSLHGWYHLVSRVWCQMSRRFSPSPPGFGPTCTRGPAGKHAHTSCDKTSKPRTLRWLQDITSMKVAPALLRPSMSPFVIAPRQNWLSKTSSRTYPAMQRMQRMQRHISWHGWNRPRFVLYMAHT